MTSPRIFPIVLLILFTGCGSRADDLTPRLLDQNAKADLDKATVVLLGTVKAIKDTPYPPGSAGYRPVEIDLTVKRVLGGRLTSNAVCFTYMFPYGAYVGARSIWVEPGVTGVFALLPGDVCLRAVNDRRPIIPSYSDEADDPSIPSAEGIARSTLPAKRGCPPDAYEAAAETQDVSVPLVGPRFVRRLLEDLLEPSVSNKQICACVVMALVWRLDEDCLRNMPADTDRLEEIRATNKQVSMQERQRLQSAPLNWLTTTIVNWGVDGALLRLSYLLAHPDTPVTQRMCASLQSGLDAGQIDASIVSGRERSAAPAEEFATKQLKAWLKSGCQAGSF